MLRKQAGDGYITRDDDRVERFAHETLIELLSRSGIGSIQMQIGQPEKFHASSIG